MAVKARFLVIASLAALSLGACANGSQKHEMMGGGMMGKQGGCPMMMQKQADAGGQSANNEATSNMSGCRMMGKTPPTGTPSAPKQNDTEDHSAHHPAG